MKRQEILFIGTIVLAGTGLVWAASPSNHDHNEHGIKISAFSEAALKGRELFNGNCAACHGANAAGTDKGPPFIHKIYEPGHHGDASFQRAVKNGVRAHHWPFGNMSPVPNVNQNDVALIVTYIRELQRANGIK